MAQAKHIDFRDQIARNKAKSFLFMFFVLVVLIMLGYVLMQFLSFDFFSFASIWIIISISYILISYYNSDKIALAATGARQAPREQFRQLYNSVEGLCIASGLPMPKIYVMQNPQINAFATGRDEKHAAVCITTGALEK